MLKLNRMNRQLNHQKLIKLKKLINTIILEIFFINRNCFLEITKHLIERTEYLIYFNKHLVSF